MRLFWAISILQCITGLVPKCSFTASTERGQGLFYSTQPFVHFSLLVATNFTTPSLTVLVQLQLYYFQSSDRTLILFHLLQEGRRVEIWLWQNKIHRSTRSHGLKREQYAFDNVAFYRIEPAFHTRKYISVVVYIHTGCLSISPTLLVHTYETARLGSIRPCTLFYMQERYKQQSDVLAISYI